VTVLIFDRSAQLFINFPILPYSTGFLLLFAFALSGFVNLFPLVLVMVTITVVYNRRHSFLPRFMECRRGLVMRILSVRPSVTRVNCDKTVERSVQIYIPYERTFSLVF